MSEILVMNTETMCYRIPSNEYTIIVTFIADYFEDTDY